MKEISIEYFAKLRDERKLSKEIIKTNVNTALELFTELKEKYQFSFTTEYLKVAINDEFENWNTVINNLDTVVFIPPVAGG